MRNADYKLMKDMLMKNMLMKDMLMSSVLSFKFAIRIPKSEIE